MKTKNKFIIFGAVLFTATLTQGKQSDDLNSYTLENINFTEILEKEMNDDVFLEFVDGDAVKEP